MYFFILGHSPALSCAEIFAVLTKKEKKYQVMGFSKEALVLDIKEKIEPIDFLRQLGGTIKIGECEAEKVLFQNLKWEKFISLLSQKEKKVNFGFSFYNLTENDLTKKYLYRAKDWGMGLKGFLKEQGASARWVSSRERALSSVIVAKNDLIESGADIVLLCEADGIYLGKTLAVQEFEEYGERDFGRPERDLQSGTLPPKLAKIMINLAQANKKDIILDPFCGSGTILQEAILLGYQNILASDSNREAVKASQENLKWLLEKLKVKSQKLKVKIQKCNAEYLSQTLEKGSIDAIISEPYLGPAKFSDKEIYKIVSDLSKFYLRVFQEFKKILKPNGTVVFILPAFDSRGKISFLSIIEGIKKMGFEPIKPLPNAMRNFQMERARHHAAILYSRPGQRILREIWRFKKLPS